jgi:hypothetical protein
MPIEEVESGGDSGSSYEQEEEDHTSDEDVGELKGGKEEKEENLVSGMK